MRFSRTSLLLVLLASPFAKAAPLYTTTDLGQSYTLQTSPNGDISSVTNAGGSAVYPFDKSPVTPIDQFVDGGSHEGDFTRWILTNGTVKVGFHFADQGSLNAGGVLYPVATGSSSSNMYHDSANLYYDSGWFTSAFRNEIPVSDFNIHGQMVGMSSYAYPVTSAATYAAFTGTDFQSHDKYSAGIFSAVADNLNNAIASIPGVTLTQAFKIDDSGRILAEGSNGDVYLLTPTDLGPPVPIPEPATNLIFAIGSLAFVVRNWRCQTRLRARHG